MATEYAAQKPTYDITKTWEENYAEGPFFEGPYPPLPTEKRWEFLGFNLISPLGVAAGPLPNAKWVLTYARLGFGSLTYKTVRTQAVKSHPVPNILAVDVHGTVEKDLTQPLRARESIPDISQLSITNSLGNPCPAPDVWMAQVRQIKKELPNGQMLIVSVYGTNHEGMSLQDLANDYARAAKMAQDAGADAIELNLSCPNVLGDEDPNIYCSPTATAAIVKAARKETGKTPLILKVGSYESYGALTRVLAQIAGDFDAIAAINTIPKKVQDQNGRPALPGREQSGICGAGIREHGLAMVRMLARARTEKKMNFQILGVGGVMEPAHAMEYLNAGANHVQCATAAMWNPYLAHELHEYLRKKT